jgi:prepilin-type N-terminal cleavage/methylation domain-containing protein
MKKAFSLMEVIIAVALLSTIMLALLKIRGENIFLVNKASESEIKNEYISLAFDTKMPSNRDEDIYLDRYLNLIDDDMRSEFRDLKIRVKDVPLEEETKDIDKYAVKINKTKTIYTLKDDLSKNIIRFSLEF